jgi:hypothetical protein
MDRGGATFEVKVEDISTTDAVLVMADGEFVGAILLDDCGDGELKLDLGQGQRQARFGG